MAEFNVTFWGVRGTVPTPGEHTTKYGGNTSCVEVECGGRQLIFDAGTGIYPLGEQSAHLETDIFLSHTHLDHIQGLPVFKPLYHKDAVVNIWAGHLMPESSLEDAVSSLMSSPIFPLTMDETASDVRFHDFVAGKTIVGNRLAADGVEIETLLLSHPDRATGYRVNYDGSSVCYITDIEHVVGELNQKLVDFVKDADLLIYDSTFDDDEFEQFIGWGHSTWQQAIRIGEAANVAKIALFHHDPKLDDSALDARAQKVLDANPHAFLAKEGSVIKIGV